jgi:hypothetical protein
MTARRRLNRLFAMVSTVALAAALWGCAGEPMRLPLGTTKAEALQKLGQPTGVYALPNGGERLQYSRAPAGFEVNNVDLDATGKVVSIRQELYEGLFGSTIQPGVWHEADVLRTYGRPFEIGRVMSFDGGVWTWRYKAQNARRLLYIYVNPQGVVDHFGVGDDLNLLILHR